MLYFPGLAIIHCIIDGLCNRRKLIYKQNLHQHLVVDQNIKNKSIKEVLSLWDLAFVKWIADNFYTLKSKDASGKKNVALLVLLRGCADTPFTWVFWSQQVYHTPRCFHTPAAVTIAKHSGYWKWRKVPKDGRCLFWPSRSELEQVRCIHKCEHGITYVYRYGSRARAGCLMTPQAWSFLSAPSLRC